MANSRRNNILAGTFVLVSIILGVAVVIVLSDLGEKLQPTTRYTVRFSLTDGAEGLDAGSPVKVGGRPVGRVVGWAFARDEASGAPEAVDVRVRIRSDVKLYDDTVALLVVPLLGTASSINIPQVGHGHVLPENAVIRGTVAPPAFLAQAGYGPEQANQLQRIFKNVETATERFDRLAGRFETELEPLAAEARRVVEDARAVTSTARTNFSEWSETIDSVLARVDNAAAQFEPFMQDARAVVNETGAAVAENRPRFDAAVTDFQHLARRLNTEGWETVQAMLERGRQSTERFAEAGERLNNIVAEQSPSLRAMIANARLASDQLKLTAAEVRAAPWKLLNPPTGRKDLENEALFDAARAYAAAVSDLRATAASLESVTVAAESEGAAGGGPTALRQEQIEELVGQLERAFAEYREAEKAFLGRLTRGR